MDFHILVDLHFIDLFSDVELFPVANKKVLSLVNDFEDRAWRYEIFENFVWDNIAQTALSAREREKLIGRNRTSLRESAKNLRITKREGAIGHGSELAEIVLYGIMHHHFKALPVVPKIFYKQNSQDNAKGADSVHIVLEGLNDFSLWFGEAKFYNNIEDTRLSAIVESVGESLKTAKLKKESAIVTNSSDIDILITDRSLAEKIKDAISPTTSMDAIKPKLNVPILLLHECAITASAEEMNDDYKDSIREYHLGRANSYFKKQINSLAAVITKYAEITFHLILFPVPDKEELSTRFSRDTTFHRS